MALKQRLYNLKKMMIANSEEPYVIHLKGETHCPEKIESGRQEAIASRKQIVFIGQLEEWSR